MISEMMSELEYAENCIENYDVKKAVELLKPIAEQFPEDGRVAYDLGRCAIILAEDELAVDYYYVAEKYGFKNAEIFIYLSEYEDFSGETRKAEQHLKEALTVAKEKEEIWFVVSKMAMYYINHRMFLNAEKYSKKLIADFPDNYQGYHFHLLIELSKENYNEAKVYLERIPKKFFDLPEYLIDYISVFKLQDKYEEILNIIDNDERYYNIIPQYALKEKFNIIHSYNDYSELEIILKKLVAEYKDKDSILALMILHFSQQNYSLSSKIAAFILKNEVNVQDMRFYLALYFQIFNLYFLSNKNPSIELAKWIESAGNWCINFAQETNIKEINEAVSESIENLFNEINRNKK